MCVNSELVLRNGSVKMQTKNNKKSGAKAKNPQTSKNTPENKSKHNNFLSATLHKFAELVV